MRLLQGGDIQQEKERVKPTAGSGFLGATARRAAERLEAALLGNILKAS
jgi:hypothetical protein